ncbi:CpsD/CapB family tyrosine-protein kinase [Ruegeria sp. Ofav3-42]|uniref:CpsD/CapB family tyrosine-protein kinase n=1 Tax=Ruegeria sp. Ofav3-42 TaxID=2917759 RepID=UPI001EF41F62|nr:CpsD/CapB family tyrosine-protein kinase [Ruegeria sp. Ofav3-42]MCG7522392.1 CpsD/CapB family tyrosine-protein kinase [Ruegeria sp. Ofav3-42]
MEKLQVAIEKARSQRQKAGESRPAAAPVAKPVKPTDESLRTCWKDLAPIEVPESVITQNRLVASADGPAAAPFDMLRTRILQQAKSRDWKRVALVSPHSACGKSTTAANLAFSFGRQSDLRTIVLDLDLRRSGLRRILGQHCQHTMADVLRGEVPFSKHAQRLGDNVALGFNGSTVRSAAEVLQSGKASEVLNSIQAGFEPDLMLFDMPPLMEVDDNFGFLGNVDCALLLIEAERTTVDQIDVAERQLSELTNVMGVVLNKAHYTEGAYGYGYGYGY